MTDEGQTSPARTRRLPRAVRERQILDAAVEVFSKHGYHLAAMDEISDVAGVSKPMIYSYLGAKEDLFVKCIRREASTKRSEPSSPRSHAVSVPATIAAR